MNLHGWIKTFVMILACSFRARPFDYPTISWKSYAGRIIEELLLLNSFEESRIIMQSLGEFKKPLTYPPPSIRFLIAASLYIIATVFAIAIYYPNKQTLT